MRTVALLRNEVNARRDDTRLGLGSVDYACQNDFYGTKRFLVMNGKMHTFENGQLYLSQSKKEGRGVVLLIHEWWGLTDMLKKQADHWASKGYWAAAVDLFDGKTAEDRTLAAKLMASDDRGASMKKLKSSLEWLKDAAGLVKAERVVTLGYCFGGGYSLRCALSFPDFVNGSVIYYGEVETDEKKLKSCRVPLLGVFAKKDEWITPPLVESFKKACEMAQVSLELYEYDAGHAFMNPKNAVYDAKLAQEAQAKTEAFVDRILKGDK